MDLWKRLFKRHFSSDRTAASIPARESNRCVLICPHCAKEYHIGINATIVTMEDVYSLADAAVVLTDGEQPSRKDLVASLKGTPRRRIKHVRREALQKVEMIRSDLERGNQRTWYCESCGEDQGTFPYPFNIDETSINNQHKTSQINDKGEHACPVAGDVYVILYRKAGKLHDFTPDYGFKNIYFARLYVAMEVRGMDFWGGRVEFWRDRKLIESYTHEEMIRKHEALKPRFESWTHKGEEERIEWIKSRWDKL